MKKISCKKKNYKVCGRKQDSRSHRKKYTLMLKNFLLANLGQYNKA